MCITGLNLNSETRKSMPYLGLSVPSKHKEKKKKIKGKKRLVRTDYSTVHMPTRENPTTEQPGQCWVSVGLMQYQVQEGCNRLTQGGHSSRHCISCMRLLS